jgi:hypothetical protein
MRLADYPRDLNRQLINSLFNGAPPYTAEEQIENNIATNVNDLSATDLGLTARRQFSNAFCNPDPLVTAQLDYGPAHKRQKWQSRITKEWNKAMINSFAYLDLREGVFAQVVLHGAGPTGWQSKEKWISKQYGIEDVLIPSNTDRSLENLPFFAIYRSYSVNQLWKMAKGPRVDKGWNMKVVDKVLKWADKQTETLLGQTWPEVWSPTKMEERFKQDGGLYASDAVPTIDCYDFYFWNDNGKQSGWNRRIILDAWGQPGSGAITMAQHKGGVRSAKERSRFDYGKGEFLYDSGDRVYADKIDKIIHFQFGDASAVAPFKYHSVRSLGFLVYAVCHLQNRLKCKFNDAVFESLMQYFRVTNPADVDRAQKVDLTDKGFIPEGLAFVKPEERWKYDEALAMSAIEMNRRTMSQQGGNYSSDTDDPNKEETATLTLQKANATASIVGAVLNLCYMREKFRYIEIARRFCIKNSSDPDVRKFRVNCLKDGVPEGALNSERWDLQVNRVMGGGNKMLEIAIAEKLMAVREKHGPQAQTRISTIYDAAITGDYALAEDLNPEMPQISKTVHDTQLAFGSMIAGVEVAPEEGLNPIEVCQTMLMEIEKRVALINQMGGMGTPIEILGLKLAEKYTNAFIMQLAMDKAQKATVKAFKDQLAKAMNEVKAFEQRQQQAAQQQNGKNGADPKDMAKVQGMMLQSQTKAKLASESHAQKTAQRELQFEQKIKQDQQKHAADLMQEGQKAMLEISKQRAQLFNDDE